MTAIHRPSFAALAAPVLLVAVTAGVGQDKSASVIARPTIAIFAGGAESDLKVLRAALQKLPALKFNLADLQFGDFRREGGLVTKFLAIELTDRSKTDIGALAKAVASAKTSNKEKAPPALFLVVRYRPDSTNNEKLRAALAKVKGVQAAKSWAGDQNLWVSVDGSGQGKLAEITRTLHAASIPIRDPILDTDQP